MHEVSLLSKASKLNTVTRDTVSADTEIGRTMRVGVGQIRDLDSDRLRYIKQLGVKDVSVVVSSFSGTDFPLSDSAPWSVEELVKFRNHFRDAGLRLVGFEIVPLEFYEKTIFDRTGKDQQLDRFKETIRNIGRADIPLVGYYWLPDGVWRTSENKSVRGGAKTTAFELDAVANAPPTHDREYTEAEFWENYEYFLKEVLPVAEDAGVKLMLHPNDPPAEKLGGIPMLFRSFETIKRAMDLVPSESHGLLFCLGTWASMGADLEKAIRHFGERDKLFFVHFRNVVGSVPSFHETFVDDSDGYFDSHRILSVLQEVGFDGVMTPDHVPYMVGEDDWSLGGYRGRGFTVGYLKGQLDVINAE